MSPDTDRCGVDDSLAGARIAVIGAGAAGLSVAHYLAERGIRRVVVFEKSAGAGGKCSSFEIDGRSHELGAGLCTPAYTRVRGLLRHYKVGVKRSISAAALDIDSRKIEFWPGFLHVPMLARVSLWRLARELWRHRGVRNPGFTGLAAELSLPFAEWLQAVGLRQFGPYIAPVITGFGYGVLEDIPAAYVLKYLNVMALPVLEANDGLQELWRRVAAAHDVRFGEAVLQVWRKGQVMVRTTGGDYAFDFVVIAAPPDQWPTFLDLDAEEAALVSRVRYCDYRVVSVQTRGLPRLARYNCLMRRQGRESVGRPIFIHKRWSESSDLTFYVAGGECGNAAPAITDAEVLGGIEADVARLGGRVTHVNRWASWKYFPHVRSSDLALGFYDRLEGIQGRRHAFFVGELFNFSTVETVCAYSEAMAGRIAMAVNAAGAGLTDHAAVQPVAGSSRQRAAGEES